MAGQAQEANIAKRVYARWVEPIARQLASDRSELTRFVRRAPAELWSRPAGDGDWSCKQLLAHLAGGNDQLVQTVLAAVVAGTALEPSQLEPDTDAENARRVAERASWSVEALLAELERDGEEVQSLLARLRDEDEAARPGGWRITLGHFLRIVERERHDHEHLAQLRAAASQLTTQ